MRAVVLAHMQTFVIVSVAVGHIANSYCISDEYAVHSFSLFSPFISLYRPGRCQAHAHTKTRRTEAKTKQKLATRINMFTYK